MIWSLLLSLALLAVASFGWGFVFSADAIHLERSSLNILIIGSVVVSIFTSIFFLKETILPFVDLDITYSTAVMVLTFVCAMTIGYVLNINPLISRSFHYIRKMIKGDDREEKRADIIDAILDHTAETGEIDSLERELLESVLKFNDKTVREIMVPRGDVVALDIDDAPHRLIRKVIEEGYSRLPVYKGSIDNIVGIIYAKDLLTMAESEAVIVLQDLLRRPYYVPESKKISQLLREMQRNKVHLAIVVDEFGGTEGIITLEDVLEEIVGEIQDEYDESSSELVRDENGNIYISGLMTVSRFNELLGANIPQSDDYDTIAGFVQKLAGKLPQKDEVYNYEELFFVVEDIARHRIKRLRVSYKEHPQKDSVQLTIEDSEPGQDVSGDRKAYQDNASKKDSANGEHKGRARKSVKRSKRRTKERKIKRGSQS
jgi:CBS domain containing-hemolysin-like protein